MSDSQQNGTNPSQHSAADHPDQSRLSPDKQTSENATPEDTNEEQREPRSGVQPPPPSPSGPTNPTDPSSNQENSGTGVPSNPRVDELYTRPLDDADAASMGLDVLDQSKSNKGH